MQPLPPLAATKPGMKKSSGASEEAAKESLGIELDNDADPEATVITVSGQGQNTDLLSQMTGLLPKGSRGLV